MESTNRPYAVITGASDGIGYELAKVFAERGYDLLVCAEDPGIVEAAQAFQGLGAQVDSLQVDLCEPEGVEKLYAKMKAAGRPVEALCVNAGVGAGGAFAQTELAKQLEIVDLNVRSSVHLTWLALQDMVARDAGKILIVSSIAATMPGPFEAVYAASKAFLLSFSEALRNELKDTGITVSALMPGPTDTNFFHRAGLDDTKVGQAKKDDPAQVARQGFDALMADKDHVVAGSTKNSVQAGVAKVLPQKVTAQIHRGMSEPGSGKK